MQQNQSWMILAHTLGTQHGVQPTRPAAEVERQL